MSLQDTIREASACIERLRQADDTLDREEAAMLIFAVLYSERKGEALHKRGIAFSKSGDRFNIDLVVTESLEVLDLDSIYDVLPYCEGFSASTDFLKQSEDR